MAAAEEAPIARGQVWRRKRDGVRIRIVAERRNRMDGSFIDDWEWKLAENPARIHQCFGDYLRRLYELETT